MPYPWQDVAPFGARPVQQTQVLKSLRLRPGKRLPFLDLPAREGLPSGLRLASLPKEAIALASTELNKSILSDRVLELGLSFYAVKSRHGAARNGVRLRGAAAAPAHRVLSLGALPACRRLLGEALQRLGLAKKGLLQVQAESRCNGLARRYARGQALPRHVDNPMFEDTIVGVVLKSGAPCDGLRLCQETPCESKTLLAEAVGLGLKAGFFAELGFRLEEEDGLCFCLQGPAREMAHEVPPVSSERVSLTFRWFREDFLEELKHAEAHLEDDA
ncbi:Ogt [Symbiodinium sp. CCMP2592]|nr:Ogt [Symbiodinium sp. CCMP2592]